MSGAVLDDTSHVGGYCFGGRVDSAGVENAGNRVTLTIGNSGRCDVDAEKLGFDVRSHRSSD